MNKEIKLRTIATFQGKEYELEELLNELLKENFKLQARADKYKNRIDKAIEYIEKNKLNGNKISEMLCGSEIVKLLEILKGENNEKGSKR